MRANYLACAPLSAGYSCLPVTAQAVSTGSSRHSLASDRALADIAVEPGHASRGSVYQLPGLTHVVPSGA